MRSRWPVLLAVAVGVVALPVLVRVHEARGRRGLGMPAPVLATYPPAAPRGPWPPRRAAGSEGPAAGGGRGRGPRHVYNLLGERPGDYAPTLASPAENIVYARTEFGVPNAVDTRTGQTLWEYPDL